MAKEPESDSDADNAEPEAGEEEDDWPYEITYMDGQHGPEGGGEEDAKEHAARTTMEALVIKQADIEEEVKAERAKVQEEQAEWDRAVEAKRLADRALAQRNTEMHAAQNLSVFALEAVEAADQYKQLQNRLTMAKNRKKLGEDVSNINMKELEAATKKANDLKKSTKTKVDDAVVELKEGLATLQNNAKKAKDSQTAAAALFKAQSSGLAAASLKLKKHIEAMEKAAEKETARLVKEAEKAEKDANKKDTKDAEKAEKDAEKDAEKKRKADQVIAEKEELKLKKQKVDEEAKGAAEAAKVAGARARECESVICQIHWLRQKIATMGSEATELMMVLKGEPLDPDNPDNTEHNKPKIPCEIEEGELAWMEKLALFAMKMQTELEALIAKGQDAMAIPPVDKWNRENHNDALAGCTNMEDGRPVGGDETDDEDDGEEDDDGRFDEEMKGYADEGNREEDDPDAVASASVSKDKRQKYAASSKSKGKSRAIAMEDLSDDELGETPESKAALEKALVANREKDLKAKHKQYEADALERIELLEAKDEARRKKRREKGRINPTPNPNPSPSDA
mgnify:CR=1 FL=1